MPSTVVDRTYNSICDNREIHPDPDVRANIVRVSGIQNLINVLAEIRGLDPLAINPAAVEEEKNRLRTAEVTTDQLLARVRSSQGQAGWRARPVHFQAVVELLRNGGLAHDPETDEPKA